VTDHYGHDGEHGEDYDQMYQLHRSQTRGVWGNQQPLFQLNQLTTNANNLIWIDLPPWMARVWTITLLAMRYATGTQSQFLGLTPDQQAVPTTFGANNPPLQCQLDYGISNAGERGILLDYPWTGSTFEVTAASIQLKVAPFALAAPPTVVPTIGAFISPSRRGGGQLKLLPTFTVAVTIGAGITSNIAVPARARSYSIAAVNANGLTNTLSVQQLTSPASTTSIVRLDSLPGDLLSTNYPYYSGALVANYPIHPLATIIAITNGGGITSSQYVVRFELDLG
jgi:hypothetical protein